MIARLDTGAPVIVSRRGGAGRVVAVATSLDEDWSTLGVDPAFPALVMGLVRYLTDIGGQTHGARVGEPVDLRIYGRSLPRGGGITDTLDAGDALVVETPAGARDPVSATGIYTPQAPGVYEIHGSATAGRGLPLAVNADRRESDLALASMEDFQAALVRVNRMRRAPETADGEADERTGDGWSLAWYLLLLALAVAFVETLLCARMDRSRRHAVYAEGVAPGLAESMRSENRQSPEHRSFIARLDAARRHWRLRCVCEGLALALAIIVLCVLIAITAMDLMRFEAGAVRIATLLTYSVSLAALIWFIARPWLRRIRYGTWRAISSRGIPNGTRW